MDRLNEYEKLTKRLLELIKEHRIGITNNHIEIKK